jgi:hypothetical protein
MNSEPDFAVLASLSPGERAAYFLKEMILAAGGSMDDVRKGWAELQTSRADLHRDKTQR